MRRFPKGGALYIIMPASSLGKGVTPFSPGSPLGILPLVRAAEVIKYFIMSHSLGFYLMEYTWFRQATSRSLSAADGDHFPITWGKDCPGHRLTGGILDGDV
jgi:hypothetical protein